ncbi:MAG: DUF2975 domain-containing protein [Bacteroidota bacterium]
MKKKYPFIRIVDLLLRVIWYLQWLFGVALFISAISIIADVSWFNVEKIKGFHITYSEIDLGSIQMHDNQEHLAKLTNGEGRLHISDLDHKITLFKIIGAFLELLVGMYIIYLLRRIFANLKVGEFFVNANGQCLRKIAISIVGISLFISGYQYVISSYIYNHFSIEGIVLKRAAEIDTKTLLFGIMIFVVAMIFIKGAEIKEEQDLTI